MRRTRRGLSKVLVMVMILIGAGVGLLYVAYRAAGAHSKRAAVKEQVHRAAVAEAMSEEERLAYVEKFVAVNDLQLGPDTKPDSTEPVPGLFRVSGTVVNNGDRKIDQINLAVYPENAQGEVIGSYLDNIAGSEGLAPGASRVFHFQIPEKKEYGGTFRHALR